MQRLLMPSQKVNLAQMLDLLGQRTRLRKKTQKENRRAREGLSGRSAPGLGAYQQ